MEQTARATHPVALTPHGAKQPERPIMKPTRFASIENESNTSSMRKTLKTLALFVTMILPTTAGCEIDLTAVRPGDQLQLHIHQLPEASNARTSRLPSSH